MVARGAIVRPFVLPTITAITQRGERDLEDLRDLFGIRAHRYTIAHETNERRDEDFTCARFPALEAAQHFNAIGCDPDFFVRLAQGGGQEMGIATIEAPAGERDLSAMAAEAIGTPGIENLQALLARHQRNQHGGGFFAYPTDGYRHGFGARQLAAQPVQVVVKRRRVGFAHYACIRCCGKGRRSTLATVAATAYPAPVV